MSKYLNTFKLMFFTLILYIWTAENIEFPGEKQGENKKDFVLREFNAVVDSKLPNVPFVDAIQSLFSNLLGRLIDWAVEKLKQNADYNKLQAEILSFFQ